MQRTMLVHLLPGGGNMAFDGTLKFDTAIDQSGFTAGLDKIGSIAKAGLAAVAAGAAAAGAAVVAVGKEAFDMYADYEQLVGGVETLFGAGGKSVEEYADSVGKSVDAIRKEYDSLTAAQSAVMKNAAAAFRTAGMSQNAYMETVTSFSAALIASLGGDTEKAAAVADKAIIDMADNANKMGTDIQNIQNAYQGFAKQNYTMLDNLKLGYGGTKSEMERLLADAQKLSGVEYHLDSYADVVEAIHVIQTEMGITGTTAAEASSTISGSVASMKAAWDNLLVGVADDTQDFDRLTEDLVVSVETAAGNILPRIETIGGGMIRLVEGLADDAVRLLTDVAAYAPDLVECGAELIQSLGKGFAENAPQLAETALMAGLSLVNGIADGTAEMLDAGTEIVTQLAAGIETKLPRIKRIAKHVLLQMTHTLRDELPVLIGTGAEIIGLLLEGLEGCIPLLIDGARTIFLTIVTAVTEHLPDLLVLGGEILGELVLGLIGALPDIVGVAVQLITMLADFLGKNLDPLLGAAAVIITALGEALLDPSMLASIIEVAGKLVIALVDGLTGDGMAQLLDAVLMLNTAILEVLLDPQFLGQMAETGAALLAALIKGLCQLAPMLVGEILLLTESIGQTLLDTDFEALGAVILQGIENGVNSIDFTAFWDDWFAGFADIQDFFGGVWDNFKIGWEDVYGKVSGLFQADKFSDLGRNIITGIWQGIDNAKQWMIDQFTGLKDSVLNGLKSVFGIASPSKLMRDMVGKNLALGIGVGFMAEMPEIGEDAVQAAKDAFMLPKIEPELLMPELPDLGKPVISDLPELTAVVKPELLMPEIPEFSAVIKPEFSDFPEMPELPMIGGMLQAEIDPAVLRLIEAAASMPLPVQTPAEQQIINNSYAYTNTVNSTQTADPSGQPTQSGDIIVPVYLGNDTLVTAVVKALQIANAQSGGVTI